jgi:hypothetical protein
MNERIEEFAKDCEILGEKEFAGKVVGFNYTKFAELIVRECGQYLNSPEFIGRSDLDWAMVLNEHFGVEE